MSAQPATNITPLKRVEMIEEFPTRVLSPLDMPITTFTQGLDRRKTNRQVILNWIKDNLVEGVDFGVIRVDARNGISTTLRNF